MTDPPTSCPADEARFATLLRHNQDVLRRCRERSGAILDHADSAVVAQDVDAVRQALGEHGACTRGGVDDYLLRLKVPAEGSSCPAVE
ncbi:hypothetical protein [Lentzea sp. NPDC004782]|uniref:hypothetical protein n=1 Tax=Lentzea sp. NPDC004782 TaxID=3154458 RepID=UPI0033B0D373